MVNIEQPTAGAAASDRADGFYWVRVGGRAPQVAEWGDGYWWATGTELAVRAADVEVLGDRLSPPPTE